MDIEIKLTTTLFTKLEDQTNTVNDINE